MRDGPDTTPENKTPRRWFLRRTAIVYIILIAIVAAIWLPAWMEVRRRVAALRAAGNPTTAAELADFHAIPEGRTDTTDLWLAAIHATTKAVDSAEAKSMPFICHGEKPVAAEDWPELAAARDFLSTVTDELRLICKAAHAGGVVRFPIDWSKGFDVELPDSQNTRNVTRLLLLDAHVSARDGDSDLALQNIISIFRISETLEAEPSLISQLIRQSHHADGCQCSSGSSATV